VTRPPDTTLTFLLLLPVLAIGLASAVARRRSRPKRPRRLSDADVRRIYRITAERARRFQNN
jgi:cytochrome c-type biogenesis protein CcmH/NrfF